jgi:integrase
MRERTGQIFLNKKTGKWVARLGYTNWNGKRTAVQRQAHNKIEAKRTLRELIDKLDRGGRKAFEIEKLTFNDLADYFEQHYAKPAKFIDNRKVEGMRNFKRVQGFIRVFRPYFGEMRLSNITYGDILAFRNMRLGVLTHYKRERHISTMNRELSCLRRIFNIAIRQGWLARNPVNCGEPLIDVSAERRRERILTLEEEHRLLNACHGKRAFLRSFIICLLDTGARKMETLLLKHSDLDFDNRLITYQALNTKTLKTRQVAMTARLHDELQALWVSSAGEMDAFVFKFRWVQRSFEQACLEAGIETGRPFGITLHSLRHTAACRLINGHLPIQMVGRILSHQNPQTTYRYLTANDETLFKAASILEALQA